MAVITGDATDNVLNGTAAADQIYGLNGNDTLTGGNGIDLLDGGDGDDSLYGGNQNDTLNGGNGIDTAVFEKPIGRYRITYNNGVITVDAQSGYEDVDTLTGMEKLKFNGLVYDFTGWTGGPLPEPTMPAGTVYGTEGHETLTGTGGVDYLHGLGGDDVMIGGAGGDILVGGSGNDTASYAGSSAGVTVSLETGLGFYGDAANDVLHGFENLQGSSFNDTLTGNGGDNIFISSGGVDDITGGAGVDWVDYSDIVKPAGMTGMFFQRGTPTNIASYFYNASINPFKDTLRQVEGVRGSAYDDVYMNILTSDDMFEGGAGADIFDGRGGNDTLVYTHSAAGVNVNLATGAASGGDATGDQFTGSYVWRGTTRNLAGATNLSGSEHADTLTGSSVANVLRGADGDDTLRGDGGNDTLDGGAGVDIAVYALSLNNYTISYNSGAITVAANIGTEGTDTLTGIEKLLFANGTLDLTEWTGGPLPPLLGPNDIMGSSGDNVLTGTAAGQSIYGMAGNDSISGAGGNDVLTGGDGSDTYLVARGDGVDDIVQAGITDAAGTTDAVLFGSGVSYDQLWFRQVGNDLRIDVIGESASSVLLKSWYTDSTRRVDSIQTTDGSHSLSAANVQALVDAMATYTQPGTGDFTLSPQLASDLAPVFATTWA
ncbi:calcium-binding protein [Ferrovibrio terrae]|nr:calcium-binding protein [Ferrovibrio terrae]